MGCKGLCINYSVRIGHNQSYYELGFKRCQTCGIFCNMQGLRCVCCGKLLRTRPTHSQQRQKLREKILRKQSQLQQALQSPHAALLPPLEVQR